MEDSDGGILAELIEHIVSNMNGLESVVQRGWGGNGPRSRSVFVYGASKRERREMWL